MASDATKSHIFQQLFSIKILTKLSYWVYIFLDEILKYCSNAEKAVSAGVGAVHPYPASKIRENPFFPRNSLMNFLPQNTKKHVRNQQETTLPIPL